MTSWTLPRFAQEIAGAASRARGRFENRIDCRLKAFAGKTYTRADLEREFPNDAAALEVGNEVHVTFIVGQHSPCRLHVGVEFGAALDFNDIWAARDVDGDRCRSDALRQQCQQHEQVPPGAHDSTNWSAEFRRAHVAACEHEGDRLSGLGSDGTVRM